MAEAQKGDTVHIHYTGRLEDGTVFDTSENRDPLGFVLGEGKVIPGFEAAVQGMAEGEQKTATIESEQAYGPRRDELLLEVERERMPDDLEPEVGQPLQMQTADGQTVQVTIVKVEEEQVVLDANHPLAGRDLTFDIKLVKIA
ncbi:MAG: peptidylprolyl isomerase [Gemmatimonadales bacterium]|nr:MAG: peptidylprolyl isomerase [Gemmatimonadales bacterium]